MNDNKYYIPDIEEFYYGFEFEYCRFMFIHNVLVENHSDASLRVLGDAIEEETWTKTIYDIKNFISSGKDEIGNSFYIDLASGKIRVKHLDSDDLESLGFEIRDEAKCVYEKYYKNGGIIRIYFNPDLNRNILICLLYDTSTYGIEEIYGTKFHGKVKNKSELERVLKMIED